MTTSRWYRFALLTALALLSALPARAFAQQTGAISGTVRNSEGTALRGVELVVDGTNRSVVSAYDGTFVITHVPVGRYKLTAQSIGYAPASRDIEIAQDRMTRLEIVLSESAVQLSAITVLGNRRYGASNSSTALKMDVPVLDVPQSVVVISEDFMNDQHATTLDDLMRNVAGVSPFSDYQDFTARGFRSGEDEVTYNGTRSNPVNFFGTPNLYNVERVEVVRGPSGVLYGSLEGGAMINMVTKSPKATSQKTFSVSAGSYDDYAVSGDVTGPITSKGNLLYRFTAHYADAKSFRKFLGTENWHVAPSVTWLPGQRTSVTLKAEVLSDHKSGARNRGTAAVLGDLFALPWDWTSNEATDFANSDAWTGELNVTHKPFGNWKIDATSRYSYSDYENAYHESRGYACSINNATSAALVASCQSRGGRLLMRREFRHQDFLWKNFASTMTLSGDVKTGPIKHRILTGGDWTFKNKLTSPSDYANGAPSGPVSSIDLLNPVYGVDTSKYTNAAPADAPFTRDNEDWGLHISDMITVIPQLKLIGGLRYSHTWYKAGNLVNNTSDAHTRYAYSRRVGAVVEPLKWISLYGTFNEGFKPQTSSFEDKGGPFDPLVTRQLEGGIKFGLFGERLMLTADKYRIKKENLVVPDPDNPGFNTAIGEVTSKGWEVEGVGQITKAWSMTANYANNNTITTKDPRVTVKGTGFPNAPHDQAAFWTRYDLPRIKLGVAAGATHVGRRTTFDTAILPKYTSYDGAVYYDWGRYKMQLNVKNITNERFFTGGYMTYQLWSGAPRTFNASVRATF